MAWSAVLSHAREQERWATVLCQNLQACGCSVFLESLDVAPGRSPSQAIQKALDESRRLLLVISPEELAYPELIAQSTFLEANTGTVVPLLLHETPLPPFLQEPRPVDFRNHDSSKYRDGVKSLILTLGGKIDQIPILSIPECPPPRIPKKKMKGWVDTLSPQLNGLGRRGLAAALNLDPSSLEGAPTAVFAATKALVLALQDRDPTTGIAQAIHAVRGIVDPQHQRALDALCEPTHDQEVRPGPLHALRIRTLSRNSALPACFGNRPLAEVFVDRIPATSLPRTTMLLGHPGAGKSMLLSHLAHQEGGFPLYLSLPVILADPRFFTKSLGEVLDRAGHPGLEAELERLGKEGQLRLLLDDLDKVSMPHQEEAEHLILDIVSRWPTASLFCASRLLHYRPLPGFTPIQLTPFDEEQRRELLTRLVGSAGAATALTAIAAEPALTEITAHPLGVAALAGLIAEGTGPELLHERMVQLLLSNDHRGGPAFPLQHHAYRALSQLAGAIPSGGIALEDLEVHLVAIPAWRELRAHARWAEHPRDFLNDIARLTGILGPYDGPRWCFLYPSVRDALAAAATGSRAVPQRRGPCDSITEIERQVDPRGRCTLYARLRWPTPDSAADLGRLAALARQTRDGEELYLIDQALSRVPVALPQLAALVADLRRDLLAHLPPPDPALFPPSFWTLVPGTEVFLSITHVTRRQYQSFDPAHPGRIEPKFDDPTDLPVVAVSWYAATTFCRWLATASGSRGARLPREVEWVLACRAGDFAEIRDRAFHRDNASRRLQRIARLPPNPNGFYDLPGNVREWCVDPFQAVGGTATSARSVRGSCFLDSPEHLFPDRRLSAMPDLRSDLIGFRVLLDARAAVLPDLSP